MKKQKPSLPTEYFRFQFTVVPVVLSIAGLILSAAGISVSAYNLAKTGVHSFNDALKYPFLILVSAALAVLLIALLIRSRYIVDDRFFTTQFGLIKSRCEISQITSIVLDRDTKKLYVYTGEETAFVPSVPFSQNENLVRALLKRNPDIDYSYTVRENKPDTDAPENKKTEDKKPKDKK